MVVKVNVNLNPKPQPLICCVEVTKRFFGAYQNQSPNPNQAVVDEVR